VIAWGGLAVGYLDHTLALKGCQQPIARGQPPANRVAPADARSAQVASGRSVRCLFIPVLYGGCFPGNGRERLPMAVGFFPGETLDERFENAANAGTNGLRTFGVGDVT